MKSFTENIQPWSHALSSLEIFLKFWNETTSVHFSTPLFDKMSISGESAKEGFLTMPIINNCTDTTLSDEAYHGDDRTDRSAD